MTRVRIPVQPEQVLQSLSSSAKVRLAELPESFGIYALRDHNGIVRYIGSTPKHTEGFRTRIFGKHTTGSEGRSHKFSQAYCTGRMWRFSARIHPSAAAKFENREDATSAKKLRTAFVRTYCSASILEVTRGDLDQVAYAQHLVDLERKVQQLACPMMRAWEGISFPPESEPSSLVDDLLATNSWDGGAVLRQQLIYALLPAFKGDRA